MLSHFKILCAGTNARHIVATTEFVLVTVVQIGVLFSELISRLDGLLALYNRKWAETIVSCPIPNAYITVHIHTLYITLP